jgi:hypothetical protein
MGKEKKDFPDLKEKVMKEIRRKNVRIICPAAVLARKIGTRGALAASLVWGGFFLSAFLYFLEKTRLFKFLELGIPGFKVFFSEIPYGYLALFFLAFIAAAYFAGKMDLCYEEGIPSFSILPLFFAGSVLVGIVILSLGINKFFQKDDEMMVRGENMIWGRVLEMNPREVIIKEEDGRIVKVEIKKYENPGETWPDARGKFLRAVGERKENNLEYFRAESVLCCDED